MEELYTVKLSVLFVILWYNIERNCSHTWRLHDWLYYTSLFMDYTKQVSLVFIFLLHQGQCTVLTLTFHVNMQSTLEWSNVVLTLTIHVNMQFTLDWSNVVFGIMFCSMIKQDILKISWGDWHLHYQRFIAYALMVKPHLALPIRNCFSPFF